MPLTIPPPVDVQLTDEEIFTLLNGVLLGWIPLLFFPYWRFTKSLTLFVAAVYAILYSVLLLQSLMKSGGETPDMLTLKGVTNLFKDPEAVLVGWIHYVSYDLMVARFIVFDAQDSGIPHLLIVVTIPLCLMVGPLGLTAYLFMKLAWTTVVGTSKPKKEKST
uniref:DUF4281 domain-containing protein n=1 Tax=Aplanochytrium stocchinoi TaxID=215587 RepID=A0A7S3V3A9_9STRA|mmetsp:Transcript_15108/g.18682  ORF Transcript_15108/g.18682 Transcript_15108/m.18682 type:complete len:163 (+) Transcript_15108:289-777(+)|eukprot:CAMPEP_0204828352 /NCGR_PEP_ID=MMETSP1346-20131115/6068_1 /ASSEMBLY_ACC=CAM_ASM_000771 /TAXON_ID=215587 /ORGANISM="Aplanochytrium stocchinoi, Strain GSBS06" /LENGTH=162 /DNA_ID=CAMNT_0051957341 /DNA_START=180 /DNA_END=668 /DNA_ORIENTATION=-